MISDWIKEGIVINTQCNVIPNSLTYGDLVFKNITFMGNHYLTYTNPLLLILTLHNITIDGFVNKAFTRPSDANFNILFINTNYLCPVDDEVHRDKYVNIYNIFFTQET